jgi:hypothetical protein
MSEQQRSVAQQELAAGSSKLALLLQNLGNPGYMPSGKLTLIQAVSGTRQHVVHLIAHAPTLADKAYRAWTVQLA